MEIPALSRLAHNVSSGPITIVDAQTFKIPDFHYDGKAPAGHFWVTRGPKQAATGNHHFLLVPIFVNFLLECLINFRVLGLRLKDEKGSEAVLGPYSGQTVVISLPDDKTIYDFDWLGGWCEKFKADFGHTAIPQHIRVPPSPRMLNETMN